MLPWYDALLFAPLALVAGTRLDRPLLLRLAVLAVAYVPGRAAGEPSAVTDVLLGFRQFAAPVVTGAVLVWVLVTGLARRCAVARPVTDGERAAEEHDREADERQAAERHRADHHPVR